MQTDHHVWRGAAILSLFLILSSLSAAAVDMDAKMEAMKADMDATFAATFGPANDDTTRGGGDSSDTSTGDNTWTDTNRETEQRRNTVSDPGDADSNEPDSDVDSDNSNDLDRKMDEMKQHVKSKFAYHDSSNSNDDSHSDNDESDTDSNSDAELGDDQSSDSDNSDSTDSDNGDDANSGDSSWDWSAPDESTDDSTDSDNSDSDDNTNDDSNSDSSDDSTVDSGTGDDQNSNDRSLTREERTERVLHGLINDERQQRGLQPFDFDHGLAETADAKSQDMAAKGYFAHTAPDGDNFLDLYREHGYNCRIPYGGSVYLGGENIARTWFDRNVRADHGGIVHYDTAEELANGLRRQWMTSDAHRRAILRPYYENHGLGVEITSDGRVYATEHFC